MEAGEQVAGRLGEEAWPAVSALVPGCRWAQADRPSCRPVFVRPEAGAWVMCPPCQGVCARLRACTGGSRVLQAGPSGSALGHLELREVEFCVATVVAEGGCWWDWGVCLYMLGMIRIGGGGGRRGAVSRRPTPFCSTVCGWLSEHPRAHIYGEECVHVRGISISLLPSPAQLPPELSAGSS